MIGILIGVEKKERRLPCEDTDTYGEDVITIE